MPQLQVNRHFFIVSILFFQIMILFSLYQSGTTERGTKEETKEEVKLEEKESKDEDEDRDWRPPDIKPEIYSIVRKNYPNFDSLSFHEQKKLLNLTQFQQGISQSNQPVPQPIPQANPLDQPARKYDRPVINIESDPRLRGIFGEPSGKPGKPLFAPEVDPLLGRPVSQAQKPELQEQQKSSSWFNWGPFQKKTAHAYNIEYSKLKQDLWKNKDDKVYNALYILSVFFGIMALGFFIGLIAILFDKEPISDVHYNLYVLGIAYISVLGLIFVIWFMLSIKTNNYTWYFFSFIVSQIGMAILLIGQSKVD